MRVESGSVTEDRREMEIGKEVKTTDEDRKDTSIYKVGSGRNAEASVGAG